MGVQIGNNNKIKNSLISEKGEIKESPAQKKTFFEKHPIICGFLISLVAGIVLMFSFWEKIIRFLEEVF